MKKKNIEWYISRINDVSKLQDELNAIENDKRAKYTVREVLYIDGQYQILYTKEML